MAQVKRVSDFNGNNEEFDEFPSKRSRVAAIIKDHIVTSDGRIFYPCQFCNKVFPIKKQRSIHIEECPAKEYILTVGDTKSDLDKSLCKIDIQQNIVLNEKMPPIKLTIRRSPEISDHFTVSNSLVLKEKNETNDFDLIAKHFESNEVTITKQYDNTANDDNREVSEESIETTCRQCTKEFTSPIDLLRHSRKCHSYPKVLMALSEVKKYYSVKDRTKCPICHKPLKTSFRSAFVKHLHTHTNEMKYSCHVCNKKFRRSDHMKAHEKRHIITDRN